MERSYLVNLQQGLDILIISSARLQSFWKDSCSDFHRVAGGTLLVSWSLGDFFLVFTKLTPCKLAATTWVLALSTDVIFLARANCFLEKKMFQGYATVSVTQLTFFGNTKPDPHGRRWVPHSETGLLVVQSGPKIKFTGLVGAVKSSNYCLFNLFTQCLFFNKTTTSYFGNQRFIHLFLLFRYKTKIRPSLTAINKLCCFKKEKRWTKGKGRELISIVSDGTSNCASALRWV